MGQKRKAPRRSDAPETRPYDKADAKIGPVRTYEDLADSEDEFHLNRDKILYEEGPEAKRQRKWQEQDAFLEPSDEEVLGYASDSSEDDEAPMKSKDKSGKQASISDEEEGGEEDEEEGWGTSKRDYYNADNIETEADALEEEAEAKRLQQKKLQKMSEADFGFDENDWLDTEKADDEDGPVTEVLKDVEITEDMSKEERRRILNIRYPEFEMFADEILLHGPILQQLQAEAEQPNASQITTLKYRSLAAYFADLAMYIAIFTSPAKDDNINKAMDPAELHEHPIMDSILRTREQWMRVSKLQIIETSPAAADEMSLDEKSGSEEDIEAVIKPVKVKKSKKQIALDAAATETKALRAKRIHQAEEALADLSDLITRPSKKIKSGKRAEIAPADDDSDFGEEETMDAREAAAKAQKKKSLRFYTSQIAQKANKRAGAGRDAGGDADIPHRERLKDKEARLIAEATKRGKKLDANGRGDRTALGGDSDDETDKVTAAAVRNHENDYYDMVSSASKAKKAAKAAKYEAYAKAAAEGALVREVQEVGADGKRAIGYVIEKNKGLAPSRKKEVRNPRVKKRMKYEAKMKKLATTKAIYKGGEGTGGYGGELTGIKTGLVKSTKL